MAYVFCLLGWVVFSWFNLQELITLHQNEISFNTLLSRYEVPTQLKENSDYVQVNISFN